MSDYKALTTPETQFPRPLPARVPDAVGGYPAYSANLDNSDGLLGYFQALRRWQRGFLVLTGLGIFCGIVGTLVQRPTFEARATMEVQDLNEDFLNLKEVTPTRESGYLNALTDIQTQVKWLQSDSLIHKAIERMGAAASDEGTFHPSVPFWRRFRSPGATDLRTLSSDRLQKIVKVRVVPQTRDIEVLADLPDPKLAADFVNAICQEFIAQNVDARLNQSHQTGEWLESMMKDMRAKLAASESRLQAYAESAHLLFDQDGNDISNDKLRQVQDELTKARTDRIQKQSLYEQSKGKPNAVLAADFQDHTLSDYQDKLTDLRRQAADMSVTYTPGYNKLKHLDAEISTLENAIKQQRERLLRSVENDYLASARRESLLESDYNSQSSLVSHQSEKAIQYGVLQREVDGNRRAYDAMLQGAQQATIAAGMRASNVRLIDRAVPPEHKSKPSLVLNTALGAFVGLFLGGVFVLTRESADSSVRRPGDGTQYLNLPELGVILHLENKKRPSLAGPSSDSAGLVLTPWNQNSAMVADSFRGVLTSILFAVRGRDRARAFVLTSPGPGDGKTTVISNLAAAFAEVNLRVLLIDGDLRSRKLTDQFGASGNRGFVDLMQAHPDADLDQFVKNTKVPGLSILGAGTPSSEAFSLLHSDRVERVLSRLKDEFDVVLIDTPPVLALPDARLLGQVADGVILLTRAGRTSRQAVTAAYQRLADDGAPVIGTVLNDWAPTDTLASEYTHYGQAADTSKKSRSSSLRA